MKEFAEKDVFVPIQAPAELFTVLTRKARWSVATARATVRGWHDAYACVEKPLVFTRKSEVSASGSDWLRGPGIKWPSDHSKRRKRLASLADGIGSAASFSTPCGVAVDASGNVYVADTVNNEIRKITAAGVVTTLAGSGSIGSADGVGSNASFSNPIGVAVDTSGNVYVSDWANNEIRKITAAGIVTTLAGNRTHGSADGTGSAASFYSPQGVSVDMSGNVYVGDSNNNEIRKVTAAGVVTTLAGNRTHGSADGTGSAASFSFPEGVAVDTAGNVYIADSGNNEIRKLSISP